MLSIRQSKTFIWILVVAFPGMAALAFGRSADDARMNQIQVLGSHNSYNVGIDPALFTYLRQKYGQGMDGLEYSHPPIERQLDLGLRSLEILSIYRLRLR